MQVIAALSGVTVAQHLCTAMMILLLLLLVVLKGHHRLLHTLLMLASVRVATLGTNSALVNPCVAATGAIADLVKPIALPHAGTTKIVANQQTERVAVSSIQLLLTRILPTRF